MNNNDKGSKTFEIGTVINNSDEFGGKRIQVRLKGYDRVLSDENLPWCFPLIPKMFQVLPKVGESVIIFSDRENFDGIRVYSGPIISQDQKIYKDNAITSKSMLPTGQLMPEMETNLTPENIGSNPEDGDVALRGRKSSDVVVKDDEVQIRAGRTVKGSAEKYNRTNPAYVQVKFLPNMDASDDGLLSNGTITELGTSSVNVVADSINLISHKSPDAYNLTEPNQLINEESYRKIINSAHQLPYGDKLVEFLNILLKAFINHTHPYLNMKPVNDANMQKVSSQDLNKILSKSIRIN